MAGNATAGPLLSFPHFDPHLLGKTMSDESVS